MLRLRLRLCTLLLTALLTSPATVSGAEWRTSRENFCTRRCEISVREGVEAYNCPVVDGRRVEFDPRLTSQSNRPDSASGEISEDDRYFWDYCTPAPVENIGGEDGQGTVEAETLPEWEGGGKSGSFHLTRSKRKLNLRSFLVVAACLLLCLSKYEKTVPVPIFVPLRLRWFWRLRFLRWVE